MANEIATAYEAGKAAANAENGRRAPWANATVRALIEALPRSIEGSNPETSRRIIAICDAYETGFQVVCDAAAAAILAADTDHQ